MLAIVDGDSILYRATWEAKSLKEAQEKYISVLADFIAEVWADKAVVYIKGKGNWRFDVFNGYKGHRKPDEKYAERDQMIKELCVWLEKEKIAIRCHGCEADDVVRRKAVKCMERDIDYTIISADKDLDCIEGKHLRPGPKGLKFYTVTKEEAEYFYYYQVLIGDTTDNIKSPYQLGPKKAKSILDSTARNAWKTAIENEYKARCKDEWLHALMFTGSLIHIQRYKEDMFVWDESKGNFFDCNFKNAPSCYNYPNNLILTQNK